MANSNGETNPPVRQNIPPFSVREVYKAGWLKGVSFPGERRGVIFGKKYERLWTLFCIHDDVQPFLEFYIEPKATPSHQPIWATSLAHCMHVSHSIAVQGDTFEFVVTCRECTVLRLGASSREQMNEWVDVLRNRLRDIGVLEPKENFYSPLPEAAKPPPNASHSSTRDPNSPLPLPPASRNDTRSDQQQVADVLYADTVESQVPTVQTAVAEEAVASHVTVISVNEDMLDDPVFIVDSNAVPAPPSMFSTRVRIASAPSSLRESIEIENSYEAIFNSTPAVAPAPTTPPISAAISHRLHSGRQLPELPAATADHGVVVRTPSHHLHPLTQHMVHGQQRTRDGLRRTMSMGQEHQHLHPMPRSIPPPPLLLQPAPGRGGREGGLVLLPRPPPLFAASTPQPSSSHHPLGTRHSSPLFRPTPSNHQPNSAALQPVNANHGPGAETGYSLKERQVARLRMEMQHPAGVRIILKKRDCLNTIALIDALGTVWVAGWRQKEKPLLYNVFHIGDQIMRVSHCNVSSSVDVNRLIKNESSGQIEFIVRRIPFGRVFHLRREAEGQSLGIVTEAGGGAEIREVVAGGLAAQQGVPPLAMNPLMSSSSASSSSPMSCSWTLTEINGRPLNLCSKEGEARDRLNAVGKAVSVLIQPTEFVKLLKKQIKSIRGYKDYLLV
ncbi:uncharacterized protein LOC116931208 [Daphnia magna]|uniref:Uncharacterized protein n=2 Tax=Daphnia magna TaxID=35525 RepID=A0A164YBS8_9CRUS|nr:uncharacterized protein LOC116931208 [Daphnia magna]XP_032794625.2 uncharacterized protein LOC116931208 [Daphnia magna]XP_032794626.1 uncharacterized protein LOC116931208 [Daphnia magna]XP_032794627.1 uncharacterized protein LOC116931208 [Daphnia magna]XP_032794628.1 uncharacterized protein LOC116931208 [Daphnia magna]XP_032794629.1 uncharacterized protein LOC116931208 [Daphnia magna]XP_032794630.1 uncharacterized protein LOC116931208 [Daphnia magna]KAK4029858.1 hypothetical protein OUZ56